MTMNLNSHWFDPIRIPPRIGAKVMGEQMCHDAGLDPDLVRKQEYHGRRGNPEVEALRIKIAARMVGNHVLMADILQWFDGFSAETIKRWAREAKMREGIEA